MYNKEIKDLTERLDKADKAINLLASMFRTQEAINEENNKKHLNHLLLFKTLVAKAQPRHMSMAEYEEINKFLDEVML